MGNTRTDQVQIRQITHNSNGTSSVTIPIEYVRSMGWRKGQKVRLSRRGRQLIVQPVSKSRLRLR